MKAAFTNRGTQSPIGEVRENSKYQLRPRFSVICWMRENNPAIYRWVKESEAIASPEGTEERVSRHSFAPSGAWSVCDTSIPPMNRWAMVGRPCGTGTAHVASNPSEAGPQTESRISGTDTNFSFLQTQQNLTCLHHVLKFKDSSGIARGRAHSVI
jgi:hypothetical protein